MNTYAMGFDFGNSHATGVVYVNGEPRTLTIPSATALGSLKSYSASQQGVGKTIVLPYDALKEDEYVLTGNDRAERYVGKLALSQSRASSTGRGDMNRYGSPRALDLMEVLAGRLVPEDRFSLLVVTGLPVEPFKSDDIRTKSRKALNGQHDYVLNGTSKFASVKVGKVLMEGAGAALKLGIDADKTVGIIDIGEFTTDLYVTQGLSAVDYLCGSAEIGIANVGEHMSSACLLKYDRALKPLEQMNILRAHLSTTLPKQYPLLFADSGEIAQMDMATWAVQAIEHIGNEINEFVSSKWRTGSTGKVASDFSRVQIAGGGAYYMYRKITSIIAENKVGKSVDPENDNAKGYAWFGQQLLLSRSSESERATA